jgi:hypothetical protein
MLSLFLPIKASSCIKECKDPYMQKQTVMICNDQFLSDKNKGVIEKTEYTVCCSAIETIYLSKIPIVVQSPHTDTTRLLYATMVR